MLALVAVIGAASRATICPRYRMVRDSKADCIEASGDDFRHSGRPLDNDRQLAWPECSGKLMRHVGNATPELVEGVDAGDE